jgi:hypothetical protein
MKRLVEEETVIKVYQADPHDSMVLLHWYLELVNTGDIDKVLFPSNHSLGLFMQYFNDFSEVRLVYVPDDKGEIQFAAWGTQMSPGVIFFSIWCREKLRSTKEGAQIVLDIYNAVFSVYQVVLGITKQERLLKVHKKLGYEIIDKIPKGWAGTEDAWMVLLTKDSFLAATGG